MVPTLLPTAIAITVLLLIPLPPPALLASPAAVAGESVGVVVDPGPDPVSCGVPKPELIVVVDAPPPCEEENVLVS